MTAATDERGRITARVPQAEQDTLQEAAGLCGATLNQFVVQAALSEAQRVIERERVIRLSGGDTAFVMALLDDPPGPNAALRRAVQAYRKKKDDAQDPAIDWAPRQKRVRERKPAP
jgi:uncharacterized protein (DUF1778 family)